MRLHRPPDGGSPIRTRDRYDELDSRTSPCGLRNDLYSKSSLSGSLGSSSTRSPFPAGAAPPSSPIRVTTGGQLRTRRRGRTSTTPVLVRVVAESHPRVCRLTTLLPPHDLHPHRVCEFRARRGAVHGAPAGRMHIDQGGREHQSVVRAGLQCASDMGCRRSSYVVKANFGERSLSVLGVAWLGVGGHHVSLRTHGSPCVRCVSACPRGPARVCDRRSSHGS